MSKVPPESFDDIDLMQYVDGEADPPTADVVTAGIADDNNAQRKIEAMEQMSATVRSYLELATDEVDPRLDGVWNAIERRIEANGVAHKAEASPHAESGATAARAHQSSHQADGQHGGQRDGQRDGVWSAITGWFERARSHLITGALTAGAVAALILYLGPAEPVISDGPVSPPLSTNLEIVNVSGLPAVKSTPPEIEHMEVNASSGVVFQIPSESEDDVGATVIWLDDLDTSAIEGPIQ